MGFLVTIKRYGWAFLPCLAALIYLGIDFIQDEMDYEEAEYGGFPQSNQFLEGKLSHEPRQFASDLDSAGIYTKQTERERKLSALITFDSALTKQEYRERMAALRDLKGGITPADCRYLLDLIVQGRHEPSGLGQGQEQYFGVVNGFFSILFSERDNLSDLDDAFETIIRSETTSSVVREYAIQYRFVLEESNLRSQSFGGRRSVANEVGRLLQSVASMREPGLLGTALLSANSLSQTLNLTENENLVISGEALHVLQSPKFGSRDRSSALQVYNSLEPEEAALYVRERIRREDDVNLLLSMIGVLNESGDDKDVDLLTQVQNKHSDPVLINAATMALRNINLRIDESI